MSKLARSLSEHNSHIVLDIVLIEERPLFLLEIGDRPVSISHTDT